MLGTMSFLLQFTTRKSEKYTADELCDFGRMHLWLHYSKTQLLFAVTSSGHKEPDIYGVAQETRGVCPFPSANRGIYRCFCTYCSLPTSILNPLCKLEKSTAVLS